MYGLSARTKRSGCCREVADSVGLTVISYNHYQLQLVEMLVNNRLLWLGEYCLFCWQKYSWTLLIQTWLFQIPCYFELQNHFPWICPSVICLLACLLKPLDSLRNTGLRWGGSVLLVCLAQLTSKAPTPTPPYPGNIGLKNIGLKHLMTSLPVSCGANIQGNLLCSFDIESTDHYGQLLPRMRENRPKMAHSAVYFHKVPDLPPLGVL